MSLSARDQQALDSIHEELAKSDPQLTVMLATFTRLVSNEDMPARETIRQSSWRAIGGSRRPRRYGPRSAANRWTRPPRRRLSFTQAFLVVYLLITAGMIVAGIVLGPGSSHSGCPSLLAMPCASPVSAHSSRPAAQQNQARP
jgi:hypothetical protein